MEVESSKTKQTLSEAQSRNQYLQDQVGMQRQVLKEMEQQLQSSQKVAAQLRAQVSPPEHKEEERRPEAEGKKKERYPSRSEVATGASLSLASGPLGKEPSAGSECCGPLPLCCCSFDQQGTPPCGSFHSEA